MPDPSVLGSISVIVQGVPTPVTRSSEERVKSLIRDALTVHNRSRHWSLHDWELRTEDGQWINPEWPIGDIRAETGRDPHSRPLFLSLRAGIGG